jgi:hypothetical protein
MIKNISGRFALNALYVLERLPAALSRRAGLAVRVRLPRSALRRSSARPEPCRRAENRRGSYSRSRSLTRRVGMRLGDRCEAELLPVVIWSTRITGTELCRSPDSSTLGDQAGARGFWASNWRRPANAGNPGVGRRQYSTGSRRPVRSKLGGPSTSPTLPLRKPSVVCGDRTKCQSRVLPE